MARLTVQFPEQASNVLSELAEKEEVTKTEILRRAIALYKYLDKETADGKQKIAIADENNRVVKEIVMAK